MKKDKKERQKMSDAFTDVAKMKKIKEDIRAHEGQLVELTLENGRKREKIKLVGLLRFTVRSLSLSIVIALILQEQLIILMSNHTPIQIF